MKNAALVLSVVVGAIIAVSIDLNFGISFKNVNSFAHFIHIATYVGLGALILKLVQWARKK